MVAQADPIAVVCGTLLSRGVATAEVLAVERRLRRIAAAGMACEVELPQFRLMVRLSPTRGARREHLHRPGRIT